MVALEFARKKKPSLQEKDAMSIIDSTEQVKIVRVGSVVTLAQPPSPKRIIVKRGQPFGARDWEIRVTDVQRHRYLAVIDGRAHYYRAGKGCDIVAICIEATNRGSKTLYPPRLIEPVLVTDMNNYYSEASLNDLVPINNAGPDPIQYTPYTANVEVPPGNTIKGMVLFLVKEGENPIYMKFKLLLDRESEYEVTVELQ